MTLLKIVQNAELVHQRMPNKQPRIFIIAGEVSGDVLGAHIMREMPDAEFIGIGGENMIAAGLTSLFPISDLAVMGIIEVLLHAKTLMRRVNETVNAIINEKPDIVLTIDSPGFAKQVVHALRKNPMGRELIAHGMRFHHVVAPQVWAWRPGRAKKYAKTFDKLYAFFEFETPYFTRHGLETVAVGHPIASGIVGKYKPNKKQDKKIITLVPGSRMSEVKKLLPLMRDVVDMLTRNGYMGYEFIIPTVETTDEYIRNEIKKWRIQPTLVPATQRYNTYINTYIAIVASGTVSAELAMMHIPTIVVYKMNAITTWIARHLIHTKWVSLVNILLQKSVYPEFLGPNATAENVINAVQQLTIPSVRDKMIDQLKSADNMWHHTDGDACQLIAKNIMK